MCYLATSVPKHLCVVQPKILSIRPIASTASRGLAAAFGSSHTHFHCSHVRLLSAIGPQAVKGYSSSEAQEYGMGQKLLEGKWALVTGSSRGIGRAVAEAMAAEAASLIITSEPAEKENLEKVAQVCKDAGAPEVEQVIADLTQRADTNKVAEVALKASGNKVDVLVNNAGMYYPMSLEEGPNKGQGPLDGNPDDWDLQTHINLQAPMRLTRFLVPGMKEAGEGHIINVASIEALYPYPSAPAYSATKWGLRGWSKALFAALKSENIKVLCVNPAQTSTPMTWNRPDADYIPEKMLQPSEIAEAIMMTFRLNPNAFVEEITLQTAEPPKKPKE